MENISIGRHSYLCNPIYRGNGNNITVGNFTSIAEGVVFDRGFQHQHRNVTSFPLNKLDGRLPGNSFCRGDITIGSDVWIGEGAMIMSGVKIGHGCVIGARTVVTHSLKPYQCQAGDKIWLRFTVSQIVDLMIIRWWDWEDEKIIENAELLLSQDIDKFISTHIDHETGNIR